MTPALETLAPEAGLAKAFGIVPPRADRTSLWTVLVDVGLGGDTDGGYPLAYVGAYDVQRRRALERGAGEAVERFALAQPSPPFMYCSLREMRDVEPAGFWWPRWVIDEASAERACGWYQGREGESGRSVLVPAPAVDYNGGLRHREAPSDMRSAFDSSPSGAAAGIDDESATRSALLEIIERDAVLCSWAVQAGVSRLGGDGVEDDPATAQLLADAARLNLNPVFGAITTAAANVEVVCCAIVDRSGDVPLTAFGSKASSSLSAARRGALQEALQIHELLQNLSAQYERPSVFEEPVPSLVVDDVARAWWWTTDAGADSMDRWIAEWPQESPRRPKGESSAEPSSVALMAGMALDGATPIVIDISDRLSGAIRALGWHAVKIVCPGYQQLRLDETIPGSLDTRRIRSWARRRGHDPAPQALCSLPHPLI